ncbi:TetR/AcrR family transcriptional regulator [Pseudonocardia sp. Ae505_Ps2]|uniref:TetR/AcrR family transcriptional regulator n=1 Tax=Pseudonocardia sp. Ae505_Ps2 TaxID=1885034 RepID=UPI00094EE42C|nr:TetR/AcrR family transcriptional regulator [Pseudonocardia sp. Ae505_Ps2]OLM13588.1 Transcriptional regulator, TetR family [Pseudonocardia sp. Ae505_Ps2]
MVGRPVDHRRRAELLDAAVDHAAEQVFTELSFRSAAAALGVSTTTLVHHFGTKERMLEAILERLRERVVVGTATLAGPGAGLATAARAVWEWSTDPRREATFRLFFAVYGRAVQSPEAFADFLDRIGAEWTLSLRAAQGSGVEPDEAESRATLVVATIRGLLLDLLAGGDRRRIERAAELFLSGLEDG